MEDFLLFEEKDNGVINMEWGYVAYLHDDFFYDLEKCGLLLAYARGFLLHREDLPRDHLFTGDGSE